MPPEETPTVLHFNISYFLVDPLVALQNECKGKQAGQSCSQRVCVQHMLMLLCRWNDLRAEEASEGLEGWLVLPSPGVASPQNRCDTNSCSITLTGRWKTRYVSHLSDAKPHLLPQRWSRFPAGKSWRTQTQRPFAVFSGPCLPGPGEPRRSS